MCAHSASTNFQTGPRRPPVAALRGKTGVADLKGLFPFLLCLGFGLGQVSRVAAFPWTKDLSEGDKRDSKGMRYHFE